MKIILGGMLSVASGKLGGSIYARNHYGAYSRNYAKPTKPLTPTQLNAQDLFRQAMDAWKTLTTDQVKSWHTLASNVPYIDNIGQSMHLTAMNLFVRCNINLQMVGQSIITDAPNFPVFNVIPKFISARITFPSIQWNLDFAPFTTDSNIAYKIFATPALPLTVNFIKNYWRFIDFIPPGTVDEYSVEISYANLFPFLQSNCNVWFKLVPVNVLSGFQQIYLQNLQYIP